MPDFRDTFKEEANELLETLEHDLVELEADPHNKELIASIFRAMHTIKGSSAMFGFDKISGFTHNIETLLDKVRDNIIDIQIQMIDSLLQSLDVIKKMLDDNPDLDQSIIDKLTQDFLSFADIEMPEENTTKIALEPNNQDNSEPSTYRIVFHPDKDILKNGTNVIALLKELSESGEYEAIADREKIPELDEIEPDVCYTNWEIIITTTKTIDDIKDIFIFAEHNCRLEIIPIEAVATESFTTEALPGEEQQVHPKNEKIADINKEIAEIKCEKEIDRATNDEPHIEKSPAKVQQSFDLGKSIRVHTDKLDTLVNLVGEMVVAQERLSLTSKQANLSHLNEISEEIERITSELRDNTLSIRMLPVDTLFSKFKRLVRDLSHEMNKEIELSIYGADTELDKTVIEKLNDPLVHIIRNSIDHGIESPDVREQKGKSRKGHITLNSFHAGANVIIQISDDGKGLNLESIRNKAVEKELIQSNQELSKEEITNLIFQPGFSTANEISSVSGRGVGMDVVKRAIDSIGGDIEVESSDNEGCIIRIKLPLTLAIIEGLLINVDKENFVIPLTIVEECIEITNEQGNNHKGWDMVPVRGNLVPYIRLRKWCDIRTDTPDIQQIVITNVNGEKVGFVVDKVVGEHQIVIKTLGRIFGKINGISGATILGDGSLALILDIPRFIQSYKNESVI